MSALFKIIVFSIGLLSTNLGVAANSNRLKTEASPSLSSGSKIQRNGFEFTLEKTPAWVKTINTATLASNVLPADNRAITSLLVNRQVSIGQDNQVERYLQTKRVATDKTGVGDISNISIPFNADYEKLAIHSITVYRDGKAQDRLRTAKFDILRREQRLEQKMLDGEVTVSTVLQDIRVNDVVELSATIRGNNPIFGTRISEFLSLNAAENIGQLYVRLQAPADRKLQHQILGTVPFNPVLSKVGNTQSIEVTGSHIAAVVPEQNAPRWARFHTWLQVTEYSSWREVDTWAQGLFNYKSDETAELNALADRIKSNSKNAKERTMQALHFVQNEIRYFGIEIGVNSHRPKSPKQTLQDRYGDCKDKTLLLLTLLQKLDIEARPALVSAYRGPSIEDWLPTPLAFDHVIAQAMIDNQTYWLDSTRIQRTTNIDQIGIELFGQTLVIGSQASTLTQQYLPDGYNDGIQIQEQWQINDFRNPAILTITSRFLRVNAEYMRNTLAEYGVSRFAKETLNELSRAYPKLMPLGEPLIQDDLAQNTLEVIEKFEVPDLLQYKLGVMTVPSYPIALAMQFRNPSEIRRQSPLRLTHPVIYEYSSQFKLPKNTSARVPATINIADTAFNFSRRVQIKPQEVEIHYRYQSLRDAVMPRNMSTYIEKLGKVRESLGATIPMVMYDASASRIAFNNIYTKQLGRERELDALGKILARNEADAWVSNHILKTQTLSDMQMAQIYYELAIANDILGFKGTALELIQKSLKLRPEFREAQGSLASILATSGQHQAALSISEELKQNAPDQFNPLTYAKSLYYLGRYSEAQTILNAYLTTASTEEANYTQVWLALLQQTANKPTPMRLITETTWPLPIARFLQGQLNAGQLIRLADSDVAEKRLRRAEAFYFIGKKEQIQGDLNQARINFENVINTGAVPYWEYYLAQQELTKTKAP